MSDIYEKAVLAVFGGAIAAAGGIVVSIFSDRLARAREKLAGIKNRRLSYLAFLESWKYEIVRIHFTDGSFHHDGRSFRNVVASFIMETALVKVDIPAEKMDQFEILANAIIGCDEVDTYQPADNEKTQQRVGEMIFFIKNTLL